ncbi:hypothetical protein [Cyclobacterium jeungdonense]|uniref:Tetracyclin repressor-like C-terminal domain-containing protein n=1 Tax=Cyclobacterium jeungdonense TaxID=708087 RepID=A0ABT8C882_9BACT|nr:hypothetical protein [Cyclobacterium jeungdonense]MDN3688611.1 hypothetical protein [Cyclobacterium jeungdonense]
MLNKITHEEVIRLIESKNISDQNVRLIASKYVVGQSLVQYIGNFKISEIYLVHYLESKNLIRIINSFLLVMKLNDNYHHFYQSKEVKMLLNIVGTSKEINKLSEVQINFALFNNLIKYALSITDNGDRMDSKAKFYGKLPTRFLSFRQDKADAWLDHFCDYLLQYASNIKYYTDSQNTINYVLTNICFYLINFRPNTYYIKDSDSDINSTVNRIISELYDSVNS